jgi:putative SOS response-associated peptidase YedK
VSRLHSLRASAENVSAFLGAEPAGEIAIPLDVTEGRQGLVMFETNGQRRLRMMRWGFPRHIRDLRLQGKEADIIGLVADLTNPMWEQMVVDPRYRCIIPITHFGNPDGEPGAKTRTWFAVKDQPIMAWAGFCRNMPDVGPCYAGMTMEANTAIPPTNDRMPVLLEPHEHERWLHGSIQDVIQFQFRSPIAAERMAVIWTDDPWRGGDPPPAGEQLDLI